MNQEGISKMETVDVEKERERFEHWFSDNGANKKAIERRGEGYMLMQAQSAWGVWLAAKKQAMEELEVAEHQTRKIHKATGKTWKWRSTSEAAYQYFIDNPEGQMFTNETRTLYAKKGE